MTGCNVLLFLVLQKKQLARMQIAPFSWSSAQTALQDADCSFEFVVVLLSCCCDSPLGIFWLESLHADYHLENACGVSSIRSLVSRCQIGKFADRCRFSLEGVKFWHWVSDSFVVWPMNWTCRPTMALIGCLLMTTSWWLGLTTLILGQLSRGIVLVLKHVWHQAQTWKCNASWWGRTWKLVTVKAIVKKLGWCYGTWESAKVWKLDTK